MDAQMWRSFNMGHVESEHRGWVGAFNTSISLGSVFERLLNWEGMRLLQRPIQYFLCSNCPNVVALF